MQGGINRPFRQIESLAAPTSDFLDHGIAMRRPGRQRGQHDHVEVPLEHFAFHGLKLPLASLGVNEMVEGGECPYRIRSRILSRPAPAEDAAPPPRTVPPPPHPPLP